MTRPAYPSPNAINWYNLINAGRSLLNPQRNGNPPTDEHIRRAISSAYYALFHALATSNADVLIGPPQDQKTAEAWTRVYRSLNHGPARQALRRHRQEFSLGSQIFAGHVQRPPEPTALGRLRPERGFHRQPADHLAGRGRSGNHRLLTGRS